MPRPLEKRELLVVALSYGLLVCTMWGWYAKNNGLPYETTFIWWSETKGSTAFFYVDDKLRIFTSLFYHLAYLLGEWFHVSGSFAPYQAIYALLWMGRGIVVFLILWRLTGGAMTFCYMAGALTIAHASDTTLNWVGQLNQFGFIFWTLAAFYLLVAALQCDSGMFAKRWIYALASSLCAGLSLFSYESPLPMILAYPILLFILFFKANKRKLILAGIYYMAPVVYLSMSVWRYLNNPSASAYQLSVLRQDYSPNVLLSDWGLNIATSLKFWTWMTWLDVVVSNNVTFISVTVAILAFLAGGAILMYLSNGKQARLSLNLSIKLSILGLSLLCLSFPAYLLLSNSTLPNWRTQLLAGPGTAICFASVIGVTTGLVGRRWLSNLGMALLGGIVIAYGVHGSLKAGSFHRAVWEKHRVLMAQVLEVAPQIMPGTIVVFTNVSRKDDGFGDNMWFDVALRLAYPTVPVTGIYYFDDYGIPPGSPLRLVSGEWRQTGVGFPTLLTHADISETIIIESNPNGLPRLLEEMPEALGNAGIGQFYRPRSRIVGLVPSEIALRRYGPIRQLDGINIGSRGR